MPHAMTEVNPSTKETSSRVEHTQSPNQCCVHRQAVKPQVAGQSVGRLAMTAGVGGFQI
jgi:hypothetical protein